MGHITRPQNIIIIIIILVVPALVRESVYFRELHRLTICGYSYKLYI